MKNINWDDIIAEWSYRLPKGYPTMKDGKFTDPSELKVLHEILRENGINEIPSFTKSKSPVSDVITEAEEEEKTPIPSRVTKDMLLKAVEKLNPEQLSDKSITVLYRKIQSFLAFKPLRGALLAKGFPVTKPEYKDKSNPDLMTKSGFDMPKQIASELQQMLLGFDEKDYEEFVKYISGMSADGGYDTEKTGMKPINFPTTQGYGNLEELMPPFLSKEVAKAFAAYTGQDEKKRGVGMAEILMALVFVNIRNPEGAGDLQINGRLLEVKGAPAVLGDLAEFKDPRQVFLNNGREWEKLQGKNQQMKKGEPVLDDKGQPIFKNIQLQDLSHALTQLKEEETKLPDGKKINLAKKIATDLLNTTKGQGKKPLTDKDVNEGVDLIENWESATEGDINRVFGLTNFLRYAREEKFTAFIAFDYGKSSKKGDYVYVEGAPLDMAKKLMELRVPFEPATIGSDAAWPRINIRGREGTDSVVKESQEDLDY